MKKALVIIFAVAILGGASLVAKNQSGNSPYKLTNSANSSQSSSPGTTSSAQSVNYKNGTFTGSSSDTPYGIVQIAVVVSGGKITDVNFLQMPNDLGHSQEVTAAAEPLLKQSTINAQSSNIDFVSGATSTSDGYQQSLQAALDQAKLN